MSHLEFQNLQQLAIVEVLKPEGSFDIETSGQARIHILQYISSPIAVNEVNLPDLEHIFHLLFISQQEDATIIRCSALDLSNYGIDDSSFERI